MGGRETKIILAWLVQGKKDPTVSREVEDSSITMWAARGEGWQTRRMILVSGWYSRDQKVLSGGVLSLCGLKVLYVLCSQNQSEPRVSTSRPGMFSPAAGQAGTETRLMMGRLSTTGKLRTSGSEPRLVEIVN